MINSNNLMTEFNINKDTNIIVAVSGGIDSMVLLSYLIKHEYSVIVIHFNHNTRETNIRDESLIESFCNNNNIKFHIESILVESGNFQSEARELRYKILESYATKYNTSYIATAHHLDDLAETILIKLTRGSNLYGYAGIHPKYNKDNYTYIRPLLYTAKKDIIKYQQDNNIPYFDDESNYTDTYLRNRYRHTVLPVLKQENDQLLSKVLSFHKQLSDSYSIIKEESLKYIDNGNVDLIVYKKLHIALQNEIIALLFNELELETSFETVEKIRLMLLNEKSNNSYSLKNNYYFIKSYNKVYIKRLDKPINFGISLNKGETTLPNMLKITLLDSGSITTFNTVEICYNRLSLPLIARTIKTGDTLSFSFGRKKIRKHLMNLKVPPHVRDTLWLITDSEDNILWVSNDVYINKTLGNKEKIKFIIGE